MIKNQVSPALRRTTLLLFMDDGATPLPYNTVVANRLLYDAGEGNYAAAAGTLTNKRAPLTGANFTFIADPVTDELHAVANTLEVLDGPFQATTTGVLPLNMAAVQDYWITPFGADDFKISTTLANAIAAVYVDIGDAGTGVHTWNYQAGTQRGVDGDFQYEFSQTETDKTALFVAVFLPGLAGTNAPARSIVPLDSDATGFDAIAEGAFTYGDLIRGKASLLFGKVRDFTTGVLAFRNLADTKDRILGTTSSGGRDVVNIVDLTP